MPSASVLADQGVKAVQAGRYQEGIEKLTEALKERPAPLWLLERSKAYLRTKDFELAMWDAEKALRVAFDRANRDQIIEAQIRRAVTYFRMGQYADADVCAAWAIRLIEGARATEDDGQLGKVDANGDYLVTAQEVTEAQKPDDKEGGLASAMAQQGGNRSKAVSMKNQAFSWRLQALTQMAGLEAGAPGRKITISAKYSTPSKEPPVKKRVEEVTEQKTSSQPTTAPTAQVQQTPAQPSGPTTGKEGWENLWSQFRAVHGKKDIRSSFYQSDRTLNVDFFVKNVDKDSLQVDADLDSVTLSPVPGVGQITLLLHDKINPSETKFTVKSMKIELVLTKETPGKWPILRKQNAELFDNLALGTNPTFNQFHTLLTKQNFKEPQDVIPSFGSASAEQWAQDLASKLKEAVSGTTLSSPDATKTITAASPAQSTAPTAVPTAGLSKAASTSASGPASKGPAYPTSSKRGPTNWDKIDDEEGEEKSEDVNAFFQQVYKNADDDTRRAMMKSYIESNGTALSTDWTETKTKKYETIPPDGAEAKKW
ncbi:SGS domain-containing protein [Microdochium trichocladiopsis]|uniref:SGS domain-containing protein n=1 Tax=Microdochium trichocladiopsis TaxID=1682393 RepID=A0A9P9BS40_9PEZI|nr:SGS domain-containing protein [Microdochium trichocladiopsis]KAH7033611.1 SGS domain-containing protein [Microdochium trichocladiopsis]